tara:strand:+ start:3303 stop:3854 length:552 start_codon:yes stop_codon:yes gene_type:complete
MDELKVINQEQVNKLYDMFSDLVSVLKKYGIRWCCSGGTLLGAIRHGGLIPWDDDCDITIDREQVEYLFWLKNYVEIKGRKLVRVGKYIKLKEDDIFIDIFILDNGKFPQRHWSSYNFIDDELYPTSTSKFGDIIVNIPHKYIQYLDRTMPEWNNIAHIYNHHTTSKKKITLTEELRKPYLPN